MRCCRIRWDLAGNSCTPPSPARIIDADPWVSTQLSLVGSIPLWPPLPPPSSVVLENRLPPVRPSNPYHSIGVLLTANRGGVGTGPIPPVDFVVLSVKIDGEEDCRSSCRDVDSGETPETPHHPATLPNLGMWMKSPNSTARWTTRPHPLALSPSPVENLLPYPRTSPDFPVSVHRVVHIMRTLSTLAAKLSTIPPRFRAKGVRTPNAARSFLAHWGKPGEDVDSL